MMAEHIEIGRRYPEITINTSYSFGLDDQEFVVSFECDDPGEFLDLVQELRTSESSAFTLRDTPIFTCVSMSVGARPRRARRHRGLRPGRRPRRLSAAPRLLPFLVRCQPRHPREPASRGHRRLRAGGLLRGRALLSRGTRRPRTRSGGAGGGVGGHVRPAPDPLRAGARGRRARPPEDQVGDPRCTRRPRRAPGFRFFGNVDVGARRHGRRPAPSATTRSIYAYGSATDRSPRDPRRGPPGQPRRHRVRRLVQRPPRLRRPRVRPLLQARRRDRQRQRRRRRRPDAGAHPRGARRDRHRRPRDRADGRLGRRGDRRARPPRPGPGRVHEPRGARARRDAGRGHRHRPGRGRARRAQPRVARLRGLPTRPTAATSRSSPTSPSASPRASAAGSSCASCARRSRSRATAGSSRSWSAATGSSAATTAACARSTPASARRSSAGWCCARSATRASGSTGCRSTSARGVIPNDHGRVVEPDSGEQVPGPVRRRLDQARPERRDRHQQEGRPGHG